MNDDAPRPSGDGLALVGLRGSGKTTVGRLLAGRLGRPFVDADSEIEARAGRSIRAIFDQEGELGFRDREEQAIADLTAGPGLVLATGGGAILRESNRRRLRAWGIVVWLSIDPALAARRLRANPRGLADRPALTPAGTLGELAATLAARAPLYREAAHDVVEVGGRTASEVADLIIALRSRFSILPGAPSWP